MVPSGANNAVRCPATARSDWAPYVGVMTSFLTAAEEAGRDALEVDLEPAELSRSWIEDLAQSANSSGGITLVSEHIDPDGVEDESPQAVEVAD